MADDGFIGCVARTASTGAVYARAVCALLGPGFGLLIINMMVMIMKEGKQTNYSIQSLNA